MSARPHRVVVIAGTATDIGKTWVSVELASRLVADSWAVEARKPAQSGGPDDPSDAALLAVVTGESDLVVCPAHRRYPVPMAPPMAAATSPDTTSLTRIMRASMDTRLPPAGCPG